MEGKVQLLWPWRMCSAAAGHEDGPLASLGENVVSFKLSDVRAVEPVLEHIKEIILHAYGAWADALQTVALGSWLQVAGAGVRFLGQPPQLVLAEEAVLRRFDPALPVGPITCHLQRASVAGRGSDQLFLGPTETISEATLVEAARRPPPPKRTKTSGMLEPYVYTAIKDLAPGAAHIMGVVVDVGVPLRTKGPDLVQVVTLIDPSTPSLVKGLSVNLFGKDLGAFPNVRCVGDVLRLTRAAVQTYDGKLQAINRRYKNNGGTGMVVASAADGSLHSIHHDAGMVRLPSEDADKMEQMREWGRRTLSDEGAAVFRGGPSLLVASTQLSQTADITARVLHVTVADADSAVLWMWDGSLAHNPQPVQVPGVSELSELGVTYGMVLPVHVGPHWRYLTSRLDVRPGCWLRLRNLTMAQQGGVTHGYLRDKPKAVLAPELLAEVQWRMRSLTGVPLPGEEPAAGAGAQQPGDDVLVLSAVHHVPDTVRRAGYAPLSLVQASTAAPMLFFCRVHVTGHSPADVAQLTTRNAAGEWEYRFVLHVRDASASLDVIVHGDEGQRFMLKRKARDLLDNNQTRQVIAKQLEDVQRPEAAMEMCIHSYRVSDGGLRYRVVGTTLL